ncbi:hypothetical protein ACX3YD_20090 [Pseudomonas fluorescens group sp. PF-1]|jgi:hypothetical protein
MPKSNKQDQDEWDYNKFTRADFEKIARAGTAEMSAYLLSHPCPSIKRGQGEWDYNKFTRSDFEKIARARTTEMSAYLLSHPCPSLEDTLANLHRATHSSIKPPGNT